MHRKYTPKPEFKNSEKRRAGAPAGNKFNEKWSRDEVLSLQRDILSYIKERDKRDENGNFIYTEGPVRNLPELLVETETPSWLFTYLRRKYVEDGEIMRGFSLIEDRIQRNLIDFAYERDKMAGFSAFMLKAYHKVEENRNLSVNLQGDVVTTVQFLLGPDEDHFEELDEDDL